jgi:2-oxoglutaroyl-CoA hydrolase
VTDGDGLRLERDADRGVATITLDVPEKLNRVAMPTRDRLREHFEQLGRDEGVRAIVLRGAGRAFTAGGDVQGFLEASPEELSRLAWNVAAPERCPKPVIALLHGYAFGVGFELALACDFRIAAEGTELALPELNLGMIPGSGGTQRLARLVGLGRAKDIVMRRRRVGAEEALALGLVTEVVPEAALDAAADRLIGELSSTSPLALAFAKRVLNHAYDGPLPLGLEVEGLAYGLLRTTEDFREGVEAFAEKRPPRFKGR